MSKFATRTTPEVLDSKRELDSTARTEVTKAVSNPKPWPGEAELKLRVDHPSTDGKMTELSARISATVRDLNDRERGTPALSTADRIKLRDSALAALSAEQIPLTPALRELVNRLAGLTGDQAAEVYYPTPTPLGKSNDPFWADLQEKIAVLKVQITRLVDARSKPTQFVTKTTGENSAETNPDQLLRKALENGRPVFPR